MQLCSSSSRPPLARSGRGGGRGRGGGGGGREKSNRSRKRNRRPPPPPPLASEAAAGRRTPSGHWASSLRQPRARFPLPPSPFRRHVWRLATCDCLLLYCRRGERGRAKRARICRRRYCVIIIYLFRHSVYYYSNIAINTTRSILYNLFSKFEICIVRACTLRS